MVTRRPIVIIRDVIRQHVEEAGYLYALRSALTSAPHVKLERLGDFDNRLSAHLDGLSVAGEDGWPLCEASLEMPLPGTVFTATVRAIEARQTDRLDRLLALSEAVGEVRTGLLSAFGWLSGSRLQGIVAPLLSSSLQFRRWVGIAACGMHRVDPGLVTGRKIADPSNEVRARALRTAGELGLTDAVALCASGLADSDPGCRFWAAWSATLLGDAGAARSISSAATADGPHRNRAFRLAMQVMNTSAAHAFLTSVADNPAQLRWLIQGSGIAGDPTYVPWLIRHVADDKTARLAGEAFSLITGADLALGGLEREPPESFESGPNDDPDDPNVDTDPDDGLPWPDPERIKGWWSEKRSRFQPGTRYFMGAPVTREHCIDVLKNGYQRQRILAAHYLCLLEPGTPLFNTSAPAWRQQRLLAEMR